MADLMASAMNGLTMTVSSMSARLYSRNRMSRSAGMRAARVTSVLVEEACILLSIVRRGACCSSCWVMKRHMYA